MKLEIRPGTTEIEEGAFAGLEDMESLSLPDTLTVIGAQAFSGCTGLKELICPPALIEIAPAAFMDCTSLRKVCLSENQTKISAGCFLGCSSLKTLRFSTRLAAVEELALQSTALEVFNAPESLMFIGEQAFFDCACLREVNVPNPGCVIEDDAFGSCYELTRGYIAPGYCGKTDPVSGLLYTILALSCPGKHTDSVTARADAFARKNEALIMEWVIRHNNSAVMTRLMDRNLISLENIPRYVSLATEKGCPEITALLLSAAGGNNSDTEFEL